MHSVVSLIWQYIYTQTGNSLYLCRTMRSLLSIYMLLFWAQAVAAQSASVRFDRIEPGNGLKDRYIESIMLDSYGYLWITATGGLYRYNGYEFTAFESREKDTSSLINDFVYCLQECRGHEIWIGHRYEGISIYNYKSGRFKRFSFPDKDPFSYGLKNSIRSITEDTEGNIWVLNSFGVAKLSRSDSTWRWYIAEQCRGIVSPKYPYAICQVRNGDIYAGYRNSGQLYKLNLKTQRFEAVRLALIGNCAAPSSICHLSLDKDGTLWIGTIESGLYRADLDRKTLRNYGDAKGMSAREILNVFCDSHGRTWVGTVNGGAFLYERGADRFSVFRTDISNPYSLSANSVPRIIEDRSGNLWFATHGGCISILNKKKNLFSLYNTAVSKQDGFGHNAVSSLYQSPDGTLWVGTDGGGLYAKRAKAGRFQSYSTASGLPADVILDIEPNGDGKLWLATWGKGIILFDPRTGRCQQFLPGQGNSISHQNVKGLLKDGRWLFIATHGNGINILDTETGHFYKGDDHAPGFDFDYTKPYWGNDVVKDRAGNYWFLTNLGLLCFSHDGTFTDLSTLKPDKFPVNGIVTSMLQDRSGRLWLGTNGLYLYDSAKAHFVPVSERYPALPKQVRSIAEDADSNIWLGSNNGLYKFDPRTGHISQFTVNDGLQSDQFSERVICRLNDGQIAAGGSNGFNCFEPRKIAKDSSKIQTYITACYVMPNSLVLDNGAKQEISHWESAKLTYPQSRIVSISYVGISLLMPENVHYRYRLLGFDEGWREPTAAREAVYTNLDPGQYIFEVAAQQANGSWTAEPARFAFEIGTVWYRSWWFRLLIVAAAALAVRSVIILRVTLMRNRSIVLEELVAERTQELNAMNAEIERQREIVVDQLLRLEDSQKLISLRNEELSQTISLKDKLLSVIGHDIKNALVPVVGISELLYGRFDQLDADKKLQYAKLLSDGSRRLSNEFSNLLEWASSHSSKITHSPVSVAAKTLMLETAALHANAAAEKQISVTVLCPDTLNVYADPRMLSTVLRNLIGNAVKFTPKGGTVTVVAEATGRSTALCSVTDTGLGFSPERLNAFIEKGQLDSTLGTDKEKGSGLGLRLCKEFIRINGGEMSIDSKEGIGTRIQFHIPLGAQGM